MSKRFGHNVKIGPAAVRSGNPEFEGPAEPGHASLRQSNTRNFLREALDAALARAERDREIAAQHGPVRVIFHREA